MNKEIEEILEGIKVVIKHNGTLEFDVKELKILLSYIEQLEKKAELGEHYKHLYSELKKQKDDVVEFIHKELDRFDCEGSMSISMRISYFKEDILRMLGEIDD